MRAAALSARLSTARRDAGSRCRGWRLDDDLVERIEALGAEARALELLERLPPDQADAVRARVLDQRSYKDIAASVRVSEAVVRKRVSRGLLTLRGFAKGGS